VRYTLRLHQITVGYSELEHIEPGVGRASGVFRPGLGYDLVEPVFRLFADAVPLDGSANDDAMLARYYKARDALQLELVDATGRSIPTSAIHIVDYRHLDKTRSIEIDVLISDPGYWDRRVAATG
jgi:hypothetical protein